jgi:hypothetical protein
MPSDPSPGCPRRRPRVLPWAARSPPAPAFTALLPAECGLHHRPDLVPPAQRNLRPRWSVLRCRRSRAGRRRLPGPGQGRARRRQWRGSGMGSGRWHGPDSRILSPRPGSGGDRPAAGPEPDRRHRLEFWPERERPQFGTPLAAVVGLELGDPRPRTDSVHRRLSRSLNDSGRVASLLCVPAGGCSAHKSAPPL